MHYKKIAKDKIVRYLAEPRNILAEPRLKNTVLDVSPGSLLHVKIQWCSSPKCDDVSHTHNSWGSHRCTHRPCRPGNFPEGCHIDHQCLAGELRSRIAWFIIIFDN